MLRRPRTWIVVGVVLVALMAVVLAALPALARRIAVARIGAAIGRDVTIGELRLNLFTRRLSLASVRVADRSGPPLAEFERLDVQFRLWPLLRGRLHLDAVALSRPRVRIVRVSSNELNISDILARFASAPPSPKKEPLHLTLGRFTLTDGGAVFDDRAVSPPYTWEIASLRAEAQDLATVGASAGRATVAFALAGAPFTVTVEDLRLQPVHARAVIVVRGLELAPFWGYVPAASPMKPERGRFETKLAVEYDTSSGVSGGGDVTIADIGLVRAGESVALVSTPTLSLTSRDVVYRDGVVTAARFEATGAPTIVDSSVTPPRRLPLRSLRVSVENVAWPFRGTARTALTVELPEAGTVVVNGTAELATYALDLNVEARDVALAAYRRFLPVDVPLTGRAVATLRVKGVMDVTVQGIVGAAGAVELKGQVAAFGEPFFLDVAGELRDFAIPRANPYLRHFMDWVAGSGRLTTKVHYRVVGDQLEASNDIIVERLNVERAVGAQADKKIGIPLGLAVAIMKDTRGDIRLSVPVGGHLSAPEFSFGEAIATVIKNVMVKIVTAPFRAIGKIFQKGDTLEAVAIDPVVFEPGGASLTPEVQKQLQRVADFMRATPHVKLTLQPVVGDRDHAALRARAATARIQRVQREEKLADFDAAAARVFKTTFPDKSAPKAADEIVAALAERETVADDERAALISHRLDVVRKTLAEETGVELDRLPTAAPPTTAGAKSDAGRIEFDLNPS